MAEPAALLHRLGGPPGSALEQSLERRSLFVNRFEAKVAAYGRLIADVTWDAPSLEAIADGLPAGAARPEAVAVRLRRAGLRLEWGVPEQIERPAAALARMRAWGASSVEVVRADPSLLSELQVGGWFRAAVGYRIIRRAACRLSGRALAELGRLAASVGPRPLRILADAAFWSGVRSAASPDEWRRITSCSYVSLYYHRIAGEHKRGQERLDVDPLLFDRQMRLLRRLRFRPLSGDDARRFHADPNALLPRRSYVLTADDGFRDAVDAFSRHLEQRPYVFVPTDAIGGTAWWLHDEPVAGWEELERLAGGGAVVGSHSRRHAVLERLDAATLEEELVGSKRLLDQRLAQRTQTLAYPHGRYDVRARDAAAAAGYELAFTTDPGRNGAGTDALCLRRIGVKQWDSRCSFIWKATTGQPLPGAWERWRLWKASRRPHRKSLRVTGGPDSSPSSPWSARGEVDAD